MEKQRRVAIDPRSRTANKKKRGTENGLHSRIGTVTFHFKDLSLGRLVPLLNLQARNCATVVLIKYTRYYYFIALTNSFRKDMHLYGTASRGFDL